MSDERMERAAHNNATWCDTVCCAHGRPGEFLEGMWINCRETPRLYPNAVTLSDGRGSTRQLQHIRNLLAAGIPGEIGVKDSFCALDLAPFGFRVLFEAEWVWRAASPPKPLDALLELAWVKVTGVSELADWESAWGGEFVDKPHSTRERIFLPSLLADDNVAVIAAYHNRRIVAGAIANRTGNVVGLSNMFVPAFDEEAFRAACVARVIDAFPGLPIVAYEPQRQLAQGPTLNFDVLGPLRVWVRP